jgi:hypothetical protein
MIAMTRKGSVTARFFVETSLSLWTKEIYSRRLFHLQSGFGRRLDALPARKICSIMPEKNVLDNFF